MSNTPLSAGQRRDRARIAANARWSRPSTSERLKQTAPGRRAMFAHFENLVDPAGETLVAGLRPTVPKRVDTRHLRAGRNAHRGASGPGPITTVSYQWQGDHVAMLDPASPW